MKTENKDNILKVIEEQEGLFVSVKHNFASIEELYNKQQSLIAAYSLRIEKKEQTIDELEKSVTALQQSITDNIKLLEIKNAELTQSQSINKKNEKTIEQLNIRIKDSDADNKKHETTILSLKEKIRACDQLSADKETQIKDLIESLRKKDDLITQKEEDIRKKDRTISELEHYKINYDSIENKQHDFLELKQKYVQDTYKNFRALFQQIQSLIQTQGLADSPFASINFNQDNMLNIISKFEQMENVQYEFWQCLEYDISKDLFEILSAHLLLISNVFRLYLYCQIDSVKLLLVDILNADLYCDSVTKIEKLFEREGIYIQYPFLLFDKYRSDIYDLEKYNILGQIEEACTRNVDYNTIIDLEQIGAKYQNVIIKPKVSKKS